MGKLSYFMGAPCSGIKFNPNELSKEKIMSKCDFKKLAIMGIASGAMLTMQAGYAAQQNLNVSADQELYLAAGGSCGASGCGSSTRGNGKGDASSNGKAVPNDKTNGKAAPADKTNGKVAPADNTPANGKLSNNQRVNRNASYSRQIADNDDAMNIPSSDAKVPVDNKANGNGSSSYNNGNMDSNRGSSNDSNNPAMIHKHRQYQSQQGTNTERLAPKTNTTGY